MADLQALLSDLASLDSQHDLDGLRRTRERIVEEHPESDAAAEAAYKLGLDFLFRQRNLDAAMGRFEEAVKRKHPFWSAAARTSLGLCYFHQKKTQKALFELRKVAYPEKPTPHSITALAFLEQIFTEEGNREEVARVRKDRVTQLEKLIESSKAQNGEPRDRAYHMYLLALALKDSGDDARAKSVLADAKAMGVETLGAELYRSIVEQL